MGHVARWFPRSDIGCQLPRSHGERLVAAGQPTQPVAALVGLFTKHDRAHLDTGRKIRRCRCDPSADHDEFCVGRPALEPDIAEIALGVDMIGGACLHGSTVPDITSNLQTVNDPLSIVLCLPGEAAFADPRPAETYKRDVDLVAEWDAHTNGVIGWSSAGWDALELAASHPELERLVLLSLPYPGGDDWHVDTDHITAKTLLLYGSADPETGSSHGSKWQKRLPSARLEMVPGGGHDILEQMWHRALAYVAPRRTRRD